MATGSGYHQQWADSEISTTLGSTSDSIPGRGNNNNNNQNNGGDNNGGTTPTDSGSATTDNGGTTEGSGTSGVATGQVDYSQGGPQSQDPSIGISNAYQQYLGRQPDQEGHDWYMQRINEDGWTLDQISQHIRESKEGVASGIINPNQAGMGQSTTGGSAERNENVHDRVLDNLNNPTLPPGSEQTYTPIEVGAGEISDPTDPRFQITNTDTVGTSTGTAAGPVGVGDVNAEGYDATQIGADGAAQAGFTPDGELDPNSLADAVIGDLPPEAMVQAQMQELLEGIENGEIPAWARPAVDAVEGQLAARGLSRSSVGQAALSNAIIQTALPMAQQNATQVTQNFMQDKAAQNQMELANATAKQQMQFKNLDNRQQTELLNAQLRQQTILSDQAADNAAKQFNAASENQTNQFMAQLRAQVDMSNAARLDAMSQFNANSINATNQFNANLQFQRDQFNAQNATVIEQSNLQWRRQVNQLNTAGVNAVNQANAMNRFNLSNQAMTFMWQEMRDQAKWSFEASQNDLQRKAALAQAALGNEASTDAKKMQSISSLGAAAFNIWKDFIS